MNSLVIARGGALFTRTGARGVVYESCPARPPYARPVPQMKGYRHSQRPPAARPKGGRWRCGVRARPRDPARRSPRSSYLENC